MSSAGSYPPRIHGLLLSRLLWPTGFLFVATLWVVFSTILWTGDSANELAETRDRRQIDDLVVQMVEAANAPIEAALEGAGRVAPAAGGQRADWLSRIGARLPPTVRIDPIPAVAGPSEAAFFGSAPAGLSGRLIVLGGSPLVETTWLPSPTMVAGRLQEGVGLHAWTRIDPVEMARAADHRGLLDATIGAHGSGRASEAGRASAELVAATPDEPPLLLVWHPERPGDAMRLRLIPLTILGFCVAAILFGAVALHLHRVAGDLAQSQARSQDLLGRDPLSGLANRLLFNDRLGRELDRSRRSGGKVAVLFVDLDRFKDVNDTYGHQAGDHLIQLVAQRLVNVLRSVDTLSRFGGDEFAIIQTGITDLADAEALARRILQALRQPFGLAESSVTIGASIGLALAPDQGLDRESLMRLADAALYQAKGEGRNRYCVFERQMDETLRLRKIVEDDLRAAIEADELTLHYQPIVSAQTGTVVGLEALVRWPHPVRGLISPAEFIPLAEARGLIIPLGDWVLRRACRDGRQWPGLRISVNVSPIQFRHCEFVSRVERVLAETGFDPARLELELTEGVVVEDADAAETAMVELRAAGVHLALDDFGTGYSSLIYLRRFAFDTIKIDRSFLESMEATGESAILVHSIVHLGRALGLTVTAEGVETPEQERFLQAIGCHNLQGFLFSRPLPAHEIDDAVLRCAARPVARDEAA